MEPNVAFTTAPTAKLLWAEMLEEEEESVSGAGTVAREVLLPLCSALGRAPSAVLCPVLGSPVPER